MERYSSTGGNSTLLKVRQGPPRMVHSSTRITPPARKTLERQTKSAKEVAREISFGPSEDGSSSMQTYTRTRQSPRTSRSSRCQSRTDRDSGMGSRSEEYLDVDDYEDDSSDYDTPFEDEGVKTTTAPNESERYEIACKKYGLVPVKMFQRQIDGATCNLSNSHLGPKDIRFIAVTIANNYRIRELDLSDNFLGPEGFRYVAYAVKENVFLTKMNLSGTQPGLEGIEAITDVLKDNKQIKSLVLCSNGLDCRYAGTLASLIMESDYIEELNLAHNCLDDKSGSIIAPALGSNISLKKLDLSWNHLRRKGGAAVCGMLSKNNTIEDFNISWNGLAEEGCKALGQSLVGNNTLQTLDLSATRISCMSLTHLLKGLMKTEDLRVVKLSNNPLTTEGALATLKALEAANTCGIHELHLLDIPVEHTFVDQAHRLMSSRSMTIYYMDPPRTRKTAPPYRKTTANDFDPAMVLYEYLRQEQLRLLDLFRNFDTDGDSIITKEELRDGFLTLNIPLNEDSIESLMESLDMDDDEAIDYNEMKVGRRKAINKMQKVDKDPKNPKLDQLRALLKQTRAELNESKSKGAKVGRRASLTAVFSVPDSAALTKARKKLPTIK